MKVSNCLSCRSSNLVDLYDLGNIPLVNTFPSKEQPQVQKYPLAMQFCCNCSLVQLKELVDPAVLFANYQHLSSASQSNTQHQCDLFESFLFHLKGKNKLLEIGFEIRRD